MPKDCQRAVRNNAILDDDVLLLCLAILFQSLSNIHQLCSILWTAAARLDA
jgi:hypothetical protein